LVGVGILIGLAGGVTILGGVKSLLFKIKTADPFVTGTVLGTLLLTGLFAASLPARRAVTMDPMRALRED
jgi:ABC-type antimicrobial peptide transport system permease subunit